jgi:DNA transformation protein and related proteins
VDREFLEELLEPVGGVIFRRMFGGLGLFRDGLMFALVIGDSLYLKADDQTRPDFQAEGCEPFSYDTKGGRRTITSYWRLPERLLDESDELRDWALKAAGCARRADAAKAKKSTSRKPNL